MRLIMGILCVFSTSIAAYGQYGSFQRNASPYMKTDGTVHAKTFKNGVQKGVDQDAKSLELGVNTSNSTNIQVQIDAYSLWGDQGGEALGYAYVDNKTTSNVAAGGSTSSVLLESLCDLNTSVYGTAPPFTGAPNYDGEALAKGTALQTNQFTSTNTQTRTLATTILLEGDQVNGDAVLDPNASVRVTVAGSDVTAVFLGADWVVFGTAQRSSSSDPNAAPESVWQYTTTDEVYYSKNVTEVIPANTPFAGNTRSELGVLHWRASDFLDWADTTRWKLRAKASISLLP